MASDEQVARRSPRYEVSVWNIVEGDIVEKCWEATDDEYDALCDQYADAPFYEVVIDREWEETDDED